MKKLLVPALGILALAGTACEQHSAEELRGAHEKHGKPEAASEAKESTEGNPAALAPDSVPRNPSGSGPVGEFEAAKPNPAEQGTAPKFFPKK